LYPPTELNKHNNKSILPEEVIPVSKRIKN
jgi:hypothetical protein